MLAKVKKKSGHFGVYAQKNIAEGETIITLKGVFKDFPSKYSIQVDAHIHLHPLHDNPHRDHSIWTSLNHNCIPNSYISTKDMTLKSLTEIAAGEEITFNYNSTEYDMAAPFNCDCKSKNCYGEIKGFKYLSPTRQTELSPIILEYLLPHLPH